MLGLTRSMKILETKISKSYLFPKRMFYYFKKDESISTKYKRKLGYEEEPNIDQTNEKRKELFIESIDAFKGKYGFPVPCKPDPKAWQWVLMIEDNGRFNDVLAKMHKKYDFSYPAFLRWRTAKVIKMRKHDQRYIESRHEMLGPDLAAAHFIVYRKGAVKFKGQNKYISVANRNTDEIPNFKDTKYKLEAIDASGTELVYCGFDNFINLTSLKELKLRDCLFIDDWCMDRMTQFSRTLEHIDVSGCPLITERGISSLHRLYHLKTLKINKMDNVKFPELTCLLLEETFTKHIPVIEGVKYFMPVEEIPELLPPTSNSDESADQEVKLILP